MIFNSVNFVGSVRNILFGVVLFLSTFLITVHAGEKMSIPLVPQKFQIDGKLDEQFYGDFQPWELGRFPAKGGELTQKTFVWAGTDGKNLYIAFKCMESEKAKIVGDIKERDGDVWRDDCVDVFLDPTLDRSAYYHFVVNSLGVRYDAFCKDAAWDGEWTAAAFKGADYWSVEISIPLTQFLFGKTFGLNLCRTRRAGSRKYYSLATLEEGGGFHQPDSFLVVSSPVEGNTAFINGIALNEISQDGIFCRVDLKNYGKAPCFFKAVFKLENTDFSAGNTVKQEKETFLGPGERAAITIPYVLKKEGGKKYCLSIFKEKEIIFSKSAKLPDLMSLRIAGNAFFSGETVPLIIQDCLMPESSLNKIAIVMEIESGSKTRCVQREEAEKALKEQKICLRIPYLPAGDYTLRVLILDARNRILDVTERRMEIAK